MFEPYLKSLLLKRKSLALGLWGDPGIGKSHSVKALLGNSSLPYLSLHATTPIEALARALPRPKKLPDWARQTLTQLDTTETQKLLEAMSAKLAGLAPFILHLEDIHEAHPEQLNMIQKLATSLLQTRGVGLLVTSRTEPPEPFIAQRILPLDQAGSDLLLQTTLKAQIPASARTWIYNQALGNPLYSLEYLRFLARQGYLWNDGDTWNWRQTETTLMPASIENLIELHLSKIQDPRLEQAQQVRAFLPQNTSDDLWAQMLNTSLEELNTLKQELQEQAILQNDHFVHPLYREVILKGLSKTLRQALAQKALEVFQHDPIQAASFIQDAKYSPEKTLGYLTKAAETAKSHQQYALAGKLLAQAATHAQGQQRGQLALEAAHLLDGLDYARMLELIDIACQTLKDPGQALYLKTSVLAIQGNYQEMQQAIQSIPTAMKQGQSWFEHYLKILYQCTRYQDLIAFWEGHNDHSELSSNTIHFVAWSYVHLGEIQKASLLINQWLITPTLTDHDRWNLVQIRASIAFYQGNYQQADQDFSTCLELDISQESKQDIANVLRNRSVTRLQLGHYQESLPDLLQALDIYSQTGNRVHYAQTLVMTSYIHLELGAYEQTESVLLEALDIFNAIPPQPFLSHALVQISQLYLDMPNRSYLAKKYAHEALHISETLSDKSCLILAQHAVARVELQLANPSRALDLATQALHAAINLGVYEAQLVSHQTRGLALKALGKTQEAKEDFRLAYQGAKKQDMVLEMQKFALELDHLDNNLDNALQRLKWFEARNLLNGAHLVKKYFPELAQQASPMPQLLRLKVLGVMGLSAGDTKEPLPGHKRQELLAILLEARMTGRSEVSKLEIFDVLYPDKNEAQASSSLKELIFTLRERLGHGAIVTTSSGYALGTLSSDAEVFLETLDTTLWHGGYLQGLSLDKTSVAEALYLALFSKAQEMLKDHPKETSRVAKILLEEDPYNRDYLALGLSALRNSNNHKSLSRWYEEARARFAEVGEALPEQWQQFLNL